MNPARSFQSIRQIRLTNTLSGKKELLETLQPGKLSFYSCGPTVYGLIHIGNLRGGLVADMFFRYFQRVGYEVIYVRNYTDIDDKIIQRARDENIQSEEIAKKYTQEVEKDYAWVGMLEPTHKTKATEHIPEIILMIEQMIHRGNAYVVEGGEVLYAIDQFPLYGKLSHKKLDDLISGIRVEVNSKKRNPLDFILWKPAKPEEPYWESPWGPGRPGWHIECSAMARKWLGDCIDVHHGGEDLIFPHHENEIAQSEGALGKAPFVKVWLHHAFLTLSEKKMSKSLGNGLTARDFLSRFSGEVARYLLLSIHYRSIINFSSDLIAQAVSNLQRIYEAKARAQDLLCSLGKSRSDLRAEGIWGEFAASCEKARSVMDEHFANDFNTPAVLGELFTLIREFNRTLAEPLAQATPSAILGASELIGVIEEDLGGILGVGRLEAKHALEDLARMKVSLSGGETSETEVKNLLTEEEILAAIEARAVARKLKDYAAADAIRKDLERKGVLIQDGPVGTSWVYQ